MDKTSLIAGCVICVFLGVSASADDQTHYRFDAPVTEVEPIISKKQTSCISEHRTSEHGISEHGTSEHGISKYGSSKNGSERYLGRSRNRYDHSHEPGIVPGLIGGVLGGVIGKQFGDGRGRTAFTVAGAIAGARLAKGIYRAGHRTNRRLSRRPFSCSDQAEIEILEGYRVTYLYQGREYTQIMKQRPGEKIPISIRIHPLVEQGTAGSGEYRDANQTTAARSAWL